jgi:hypothetical protein
MRMVSLASGRAIVLLRRLKISLKIRHSERRSSKIRGITKIMLGKRRYSCNISKKKIF